MILANLHTTTTAVSQIPLSRPRLVRYPYSTSIFWKFVGRQAVQHPDISSFL